MYTWNTIKQKQKAEHDTVWTHKLQLCRNTCLCWQSWERIWRHVNGLMLSQLVFYYFFIFFLWKLFRFMLSEERKALPLTRSMASSKSGQASFRGSWSRLRSVCKKVQRAHVKKAGEPETRMPLLPWELRGDGSPPLAGLPTRVSSGCSLDSGENACLFNRFVNKGWLPPLSINKHYLLLFLC